MEVFELLGFGYIFFEGLGRHSRHVHCCVKSISRVSSTTDLSKRPPPSLAKRIQVPTVKWYIETYNTVRSQFSKCNIRHIDKLQALGSQWYGVFVGRVSYFLAVDVGKDIDAHSCRYEDTAVLEGP